MDDPSDDESSSSEATPFTSKTLPKINFRHHRVPRKKKITRTRRPSVDDLDLSRRYNESSPAFAIRIVVMRFLQREPKLAKEFQKQNWFPIFARIDKDSSGFVELAELKQFLRIDLHLTVLSEGVMDALLSAMEKNQSCRGRVTPAEFANFMRRHYQPSSASEDMEPLSELPEDEFGPQRSQRDRVLETLATAFEKTILNYGGSRDWYPLVAQFDKDHRKTIEPADALRIVRVGLRIKPREISDDDVLALVESCHRSSVASSWPTHDNGLKLRLGHVAAYLNKYALPPTADPVPPSDKKKPPRWDYSINTAYSLIESGVPIHTFDDVQPRALPPSQRALVRRVFRAAKKKAIVHDDEQRPEIDDDDEEDDDDIESEELPLAEDSATTTMTAYEPRKGRFVVVDEQKREALNRATKRAALKQRKGVVEAIAREHREHRAAEAERERDRFRAAWDNLTPLLDEWRCDRYQKMIMTEGTLNNTAKLKSSASKQSVFSDVRSRSDVSVSSPTKKRVSSRRRRRSKQRKQPPKLTPDGSVLGELALHPELRYSRYLDLRDRNLKGRVPPQVFALLGELDWYDLTGNDMDRGDPVTAIAVTHTCLKNQRYLRVPGDAQGDSDDEFAFLDDDVRRRNAVAKRKLKLMIPSDGDTVVPEGLAVDDVVELELQQRGPTSAEPLASPRRCIGLREGSLRLRRLALSGQRLDGISLQKLLVELDPVRSTLRDLNLAGSRCGGTLEGIETFGALRLVHLSDCNLQGPLDPAFQLPKLELLSVHSNRLEGSIPASIASRSLKWLYLHGNRLTGAIPVDALVSFTNLETLWLDHNDLADLRQSDFDRLDAVVRGTVRVDTVVPDTPKEDDTQDEEKKTKAMVEMVLRIAFSSSSKKSDWQKVLGDRGDSRTIDLLKFTTAIRRELRVGPDLISNADIASYFASLQWSLGPTIALGRLVGYLTRLPKFEKTTDRCDPIVTARVVALVLRSSNGESLGSLDDGSGTLHFRNFRTFLRRLVTSDHVTDADLRLLWHDITGGGSSSCDAVSIDDLITFLRKKEKRFGVLIERFKQLPIRPSTDSPGQRRPLLKRLASTARRASTATTSFQHHHHPPPGPVPASAQGPQGLHPRGHRRSTLDH